MKFPSLCTAHSLLAWSQSACCTNVTMADWKGLVLYIAIVSIAPNGDRASAISFFENCWGISHTLTDLVLVSCALGMGASLGLVISLSVICCVYAPSAFLKFPNTAVISG